MVEEPSAEEPLSETSIPEEPVAEAATLADSGDDVRTLVSDDNEVAEEELVKNQNLDNIVLALLFSSDEPLSVRKMASIIEDAPVDDIKRSIEQWSDRIESERWSLVIEKVAGGYQFASHPDYAPYIARLYSGKRKLRLSKAGLETMAIIAYKQPVTRAEIENVRGVSSGGVITNLMERGLVKIEGKAKVLGAPFLYGSTTEFLEYLGLNSLRDLPSLEELEALLEKEAYPEGVDPVDPETTDTPEEAELAEGTDAPMEADEDAQTLVAEALSNLKELANAARQTTIVEPEVAEETVTEAESKETQSVEADENTVATPATASVTDQFETGTAIRTSSQTSSEAVNSNERTQDTEREIELHPETESSKNAIALEEGSSAEESSDETETR